MRAEYPRWLLYQTGAPKKRAHIDPRFQLSVGWRTAQRPLERAIEEFRPDVILAHHSATNGYLATRIQQRWGLPFVVVDLDFDEIVDCERYPGRKAVFDDVAWRASHMVAISHRMRRSLEKLFPQARVKVVALGADPIATGIEAVRRPPELEGKTVIFSAAKFYKRKGLPVLAEAFARIAHRHPAAILRIAGDGEDRREVERIVTSAGIDSQVQLLGLQPHPRVLQEMVWCDLFALVGWDEPQGVVFSEAMSAGKPVVCANDGGINDLLEHGVHGLTVEPRSVEAAAEALDRLLSDAPFRLRLGRQARQRFESGLSCDANAQSMIDILADACHPLTGDRGQMATS